MSRLLQYSYEQDNVGSCRCKPNQTESKWNELNGTKCGTKTSEKKSEKYQKQDAMNGVEWKEQSISGVTNLAMYAHGGGGVPLPGPRKIPPPPYSSASVKFHGIELKSHQQQRQVSRRGGYPEKDTLATIRHLLIKMIITDIKHYFPDNDVVTTRIKVFNPANSTRTKRLGNICPSRN